MLSTFLCSAALAAFPSGLAGDPVAAWTEDVLHFVAELERLHPAPYFGCPREDFERGVDELLGALEDQRENERLVGFLKLVARLSRAGRDGHSMAWPMRGHVLPLQLYHFTDGWFVVDSPRAELVGAKVVAVGGVPVEEACARLAPLLTQDNAWNLRLKLGHALVTTEVLDGVGLADGETSVRVRLERAGKSEELALAGDAANVLHLWGRPVLPPRAGALWLEGHEHAYRLHVLAPERALYVQYNAVQAADAEGRTLADFAHELGQVFAQHGLARVIVDVRANGGGDNTTFGPLVAALQTPALGRAGALFCLMGRNTFSAAGNFVTVLERDTEALLVGEPTGGAPNQYGDAETVPLPNHPDVLVRVSTRYHRFAAEDDPRITHEPDLAVPFTSADYFAGRDPVLRAALDYAPPR